MDAPCDVMSNEYRDWLVSLRLSKSYDTGYPMSVLMQQFGLNEAEMKDLILKHKVHDEQVFTIESEKDRIPWYLLTLEFDDDDITAKPIPGINATINEIQSYFVGLSNIYGSHTYKSLSLTTFGITNEAQYDELIAYVLKIIPSAKLFIEKHCQYADAR
jgi:hypothetical protein